MPHKLSPWDLCLDELRKQCERFLPAEVAGFRWNGFGDSFLHDVQLGSARYLPDGNSRLHFPRQIGVVERVRMANAFIWNQFQVLSAKRVALACRKVRERHLVGAANPGVRMVNLAGESMRWKPFSHCVGIEKCPIHAFGRRTKNTV